MDQMANVNIGKIKRLPTFKELRRKYSLPKALCQSITDSRKIVENIIRGVDDRILLIVGPCSVHDVKEAVELAKKIAKLAKEYRKRYFIVMRFCFDKPRTKNDWPGIMLDPWHDGTYDIAYGQMIVRQAMIEIASLGLPIACEMLDKANYHIISDIPSYAWVGARTVGSPLIKREASGITVPLGVKNSNKEDGIGEVINALDTITKPSVFIGPDDDGRLSRIPTKGQKLAHLILRGEKSGPNYKIEKIEKAVADLNKAGYCESVIVDCSHGNCENDYLKQGEVFLYCLNLIKSGNRNVRGLMVEMNHKEGKQNHVRLGTVEARGKLLPGLSVTDPCISFEQFKHLLGEGEQILS